MATIERISIALTQDMAALAREAIAIGEYASNSEVICDASWDWKLKRTLRQQQIDEVRRLWEEGIASGSAGPLDVAAIKQQARRRFAAEPASLTP
ncbi:MAG: type II toxin-antitoxin system ParD family antitoxin [Chloroflexi bacterium]|nr:type II toxin-antitoxin system ParD family antitoxin [Chloroflexota bacterium]